MQTSWWMRVLVILIICLCSTSLRVESGSQKSALLELHELDWLAHTYTTPKQISEFLTSHFTFQSDVELFGQVEYWQRPDEFLARRKGDCEDYAVLAKELLVRNGYEAYLFSLFGLNQYGHTICVYRDREGRFNAINEARHYRYRVSSLEDVATQMFQGWTFGGIVEQDGTQSKLIREITNPRPVLESSWTDMTPEMLH
jgi:hypothetical protein